MTARSQLLAGTAAIVLLAGSLSLAEAARASAGPVEVARADNAVLLAGDEVKRLCIGLNVHDTACAEPYEGAVTTGGLTTGDRAYVGAAVPAAAARVEVRRAGVLLASAPTVAGEAYKGVRAGSVRFALVRLPKGTRMDGLRVRAVDAAGSLISVTAPDDEAELLLGRTRLLKGHARDVTWSVTAEQQTAFQDAATRLEKIVTGQLSTVAVNKSCNTGSERR